MAEMDRKAAKEEKRRQKLERFLQKKTAEVAVSRPREYKSGGYDPETIEAKWYRHWEESGLFRPVEGGAKYVIPIPPPNVTGHLHIGHAMMVAIQDALCRYKRMCGFEVLYIPGTDHAGIATQSVVAKQLEKRGVVADRAMFLEEAWAWKNRHGNRIYEQFKRLGTSVDFGRERFTLDPKMNEAVVEAFIRLYNKGLVYREPKIVNWCGRLSTTLSDLEVNHEDIGPNTVLEVDGGKYEFGVLYYFRYPLTSDREFGGNLDSLPNIEVATTRPETILGDTGICANRRDARFGKEGLRKMFGRDVDEVYAVNPLTLEVIPVVFDDHADMDFGTGVLKLTPAHDPCDFELAKRHGLGCKAVLDAENRVTEGMFKGMKRFEARKAVVARLGELGLFVDSKGYGQTIPRCSRSNDIIEPMIKSQWWLDCKEMAAKAADAVRSGRIDIQPEEAERQWHRWLEGIRDWCLSRQLWWGHRIPAYRDPSGQWHVGRSREEAAVQSGHRAEDLEQDEDVLDTWFSSGLWPFAILGWPEKTADFERYYPTTMLETGSDILFFWVARMVMLGIELTGQEPFSQVLLHGIVRDAHGRKMSKSLGNVIDPIFVIDGCALDGLVETMKSGNLANAEVKRAETALRQDFPNGIPRCGADALRFTLLSYTSGMKDINLDILRVEGYRRFCNKIWNAQKFVKMVVDELGGCRVVSVEDLAKRQGGCIGWILGRRNETIENVQRALDGFNFMAATQAVHQFFIYDVCDVFVEIVKGCRTQEYVEVLLTVFVDCMKMLHPFMPFITEEVFSNYFDTSISVSRYPVADGSAHENRFAGLLALMKQIRVLMDAVERAVVEVSPPDDVDADDLVHIRALCRKVVEVRVVEGKPGVSLAEE